MEEDIRKVIGRQATRIQSLQRLVFIVIAALTVSLIFNLWQTQQLSRIDGRITDFQTALPGMADKKIQEMTPQLEAKTARIDRSAEQVQHAMESLDTKLDAAGDRIQARVLQQVNAELPLMLDRYFQSRVDGLRTR